MEGLCPCGHEPTGSIVPVSQLCYNFNYPIQCMKLILPKFLRNEMQSVIEVMCLMLQKFGYLFCQRILRKMSPPLWARRYHAHLSRSGPGFDPRSGQVSCMRFFSEFFLTCKTNVGKLQAPKVPEKSFGHHYHHQSLRAPIT